MLPERKRTYKAVVVIIIGFLVISLLTKAFWPLCIAGTVAILSLLSYKVAVLISRLWLWIGKMLGYINSRILLTIIYFTILLPLSVLSRLFGKKDPLQLCKKEGSYYSERNYTYSKRDFEKPW